MDAYDEPTPRAARCGGMSPLAIAAVTIICVRAIAPPLYDAVASTAGGPFSRRSLMHLHGGWQYGRMYNGQWGYHAADPSPSPSPDWDWEPGDDDILDLLNRPPISPPSPPPYAPATSFYTSHTTVTISPLKQGFWS